MDSFTRIHADSRAYFVLKHHICCFFPGAGLSSSSSAGGASHGGRGGAGALPQTNLPYCTIYTKCSWGSGGGSRSGTGGRGGGYIHITITQTFLMDGYIWVNGTKPTVSNNKFHQFYRHQHTKDSIIIIVSSRLDINFSDMVGNVCYQIRH